MFLSFEDLATDQVAAFLRLRLPAAGRHWWPILQDAALIRELHTYGQHVPLGVRREGAAQHQGLGTQLMQEAERIAREEFGLRRMAVIAGVGVRDYYRRLGYRLIETYMIKTLPCTPSYSSVHSADAAS